MLAMFQTIPTAVYIAVGVVMLPVVVIFGSLLIKILWGFWALPLAIAISGYAIWQMGMDWFWLVAIGIIVGILMTWMWQRTRLFLAGDRVLERVMFLGD